MESSARPAEIPVITLRVKRIWHGLAYLVIFTMVAIVVVARYTESDEGVMFLFWLMLCANLLLFVWQTGIVIGAATSRLRLGVSEYILLVIGYLEVFSLLMLIYLFLEYLDKLEPFQQ